MYTHDTPDYDELFPDCRETGNSQLRQCHLVMLRMLKILDHLSRRHGFAYWLDHGSLLGAVRHQGFIPWDGDLDIAMLRKDYEKFVANAVPELPNDIFFQSIATDPFYDKVAPQGKLRDKYSHYIDRARNRPHEKRHNGLQIDIAVYDRLFAQPIAAIYNLKFLRLLRRFVYETFDSSLLLLNPHQWGYPLCLYKLVYWMPEY